MMGLIPEIAGNYWPAILTNNLFYMKTYTFSVQLQFDHENPYGNVQQLAIETIELINLELQRSALSTCPQILPIPMELLDVQDSAH